MIKTEFEQQYDAWRLLVCHSHQGFFLLLTVWVLFSLNLPCFAAAGPQLTVNTERIDLGRVDTTSGQKFFSASFTLSNTGDAVLILDKPRVSCGCTKVQLPESKLAPGKSTLLTATIDIRMHYGRKRFYVFVPSNASDSPRRLIIDLTIPDTRSGWELIPFVLPVRKGSPVRISVRHFDTNAELRVTAVKLPAGCEVVTSLPLIIAPGGIGRMDIRCSAAFVAAGGQHPFTVFTNDPKKTSADGWLSVHAPEVPKAVDISKASKSTKSLKVAPAVVSVVPIEAAILQQLLAAKQTVSDLHMLDVRTAKEYAEGHISHSFFYPSTDWRTADPPWPPTAMLVLVAENDEAAERAAGVLSTTACRHVLILRGGIKAWIAVAGKKSLVTGYKPGK